jgi:AraC-like DNA-binding protein
MPRIGQDDLRRRLPKLDRLPRAVYGRLESLPAGSWTRVHSHDWVQLSYAISGVLTVRTLATRGTRDTRDTWAGSFVAPPQRAIWVPPGLEHEVLTSGRAEMRSLYLDPARTSWAPARCRVLEVTPLARELIRAAAELAPEYDEAGPDGRLVEVLLDQLAGLPEVGLSLPLPADPRLSGVSQALQRAPDDGRPMAEWARTASMSERTLSRLFQRETGLSFREWRTRLRLLMSISGLERGRSVTAVALDSGYDSVSAFIAAFRRLFGKTPGDFFG